MRSKCIIDLRNMKTHTAQLQVAIIVKHYNLLCSGLRKCIKINGTGLQSAIVAYDLITS